MTDFNEAVQPPHARFNLGSLAATPAALAALQLHGIEPLSLLARHAGGDFGDLDADDLAANEEAIAVGFRVFSAYRLAGTSDAPRVWVITEADRSATTLLLPTEY